jgi:hypothetical protein
MSTGKKVTGIRLTFGERLHMGEDGTAPAWPA